MDISEQSPLDNIELTRADHERLVDGVTITGQRDRGGLRQRLDLALGNRAHPGLQVRLFGRELEIHQIRSVVARARQRWRRSNRAPRGGPALLPGPPALDDSYAPAPASPPRRRLSRLAGGPSSMADSRALPAVRRRSQPRQYPVELAGGVARS